MVMNHTDGDTEMRHGLFENGVLVRGQKLDWHTNHKQCMFEGEFNEKGSITKGFHINFKCPAFTQVASFDFGEDYQNQTKACQPCAHAAANGEPNHKHIFQKWYKGKVCFLFERKSDDDDVIDEENAYTTGEKVNGDR